MKKNKLPKGLYLVHNIFNEYVVCIHNSVFNFNGENVSCGYTEKEAIKNYFDFVKKHGIEKEIDIEEVKRKIKNSIRRHKKQWKEESESAALGHAEGLREALELLNEK